MVILAARPAGQRLTPIQQAVRDRFAEGGSVGQTLVIVLVVVASVVLVYLLTRARQKSARRERSGDPKRLYQELLGKLALTAPQRKLLTAVARDLRLQDPTAFLLSPSLYDRRITQWQEKQLAIPNSRRIPQRGQLSAQIRRVLFPDT